MKIKNKTISLVIILMMALTATASGSPKRQQQHSETHGVNKRGDRVMGFSHMKATHHFRLAPDGGRIEVAANDPQDTATREQIRMHLSHIAGMFANGDFDAPMLIHARTPPGVPAMKRLKAEISYEYEEREAGGLVRIKTNNARALAAVHEFLRFQIKDHRTGDSLKVEK
ncbi:MAG: hypothetical protein QOD00_2213 [Blastocatellia bacterium]|jgi:hypothetical protein|nr:hypothetical protein [Blastocatellia bacterium]